MRSLLQPKILKAKLRAAVLMVGDVSSLYCWVNIEEKEEDDKPADWI